MATAASPAQPVVPATSAAPTSTSATSTAATAAARQPRQGGAGLAFRYALIALALVWALFPILYIVSAALNPTGSLQTTSPLPDTFSTANFSKLFHSETFPFWTWFRNSLLIAGAGTLLQVFLACCAAYAFSRLRFAGRRPGLMFLLLAQMFPAMLAFPAIVLMFYRIGDVFPSIGMNTQAALMLVYLGGAMGSNVWLLKGYFDTVPKELDEAAKMDGASHARIFFTMTLRLVAPILVTVGILAFVGLWGEFMMASLILKESDQFTLGVGLYNLNNADKQAFFGWFCAGSLVASLPVVLLYLSVQRQLISGLTTGSVK